MITVLIRTGEKTEPGPVPLKYDVTERATWHQVTLPGNPSVSLERFGIAGMWTLVSVEEPLQEMTSPVYYDSPFLPGATAYQAPHLEVTPNG